MSQEPGGNFEPQNDLSNIVKPPVHYFILMWKRYWPLTTTEMERFWEMGLPLIWARHWYVPASSLLTFLITSVLSGSWYIWPPSEVKEVKAETKNKRQLYFWMKIHSSAGQSKLQSFFNMLQHVDVCIHPTHSVDPVVTKDPTVVQGPGPTISKDFLLVSEPLNNHSRLASHQAWHHTICVLQELVVCGGLAKWWTLWQKRRSLSWLYFLQQHGWFHQIKQSLVYLKKHPLFPT